MNARSLLTVAVLLPLGWRPSGEPPRPRPNILLILTDDMGYGDYSLAGNPHLHTPNLDRLAREGVRFTNFYVSPVCAPTRASLLTGRYHQRTGVRSVTNGFETIAPDETTLAEILNRAGYRTGLFGKWHLGENYPSLPNAQGFGTYIGFRTGHFDHYVNPTLERNGQPYPTQGYITDVLTDEAIRFVDQAEGGKPFFCYLPYNAPHTPLDVADRYVQAFRAKGLSDNVARVYGMIKNLDENVGRLLAHLDQRGLTSNTIVIFLSDNGPIWRTNRPDDVRYNAGLRDKKFSVYEGGIRTQCFVRWPGHISANRAEEAVAAHIDLLPTLLDLGGIAQPKPVAMDGRSLRPLLEASPQAWPERTLYLNYALKTLHEPAPYPGGMARTQRYKMVNGTELYDLQADPAEARNVADQHPALLHRLDSLYRQWWQQTHAQRGFRRLPIPVGHAEANPVTLTPHLGRAQGTLRYLGDRGIIDGKRVIGPHPEGVDGDWLSGWTSSQDEVYWDLAITRPGTYDVALTLRAQTNTSDPVVQVRVGNRSVKKSLTTLKPGEWTPRLLGRLTLNAGPATLTVRATNRTGRDPIDLKNVQLYRLK